MKLNHYFDQVQIVNLPERRDRRREMQAQLKKIGMQASFFPAVRVAEQGDWPSLGARGCFQSHFRILQQALRASARNVLILEDDLDFSPLLGEVEEELMSKIAGGDWDLLYLGHVEKLPDLGGVELLPWRAPLMTAHFYAINGRVLERLLKFLELVQVRQAGDPLGGPQHYDGALCMFRAQNPDVKTLIVAPNLGSQRSSRSNISSAWYDQMPVLGGLINTARRLRRMGRAALKV
jgi:hypothetical protein